MVLMKQGRAKYRALLKQARQLLMTDSFICHKQAVDLWAEISVYYPRGWLVWLRLCLRPWELFNYWRLKALQKQFKKYRQCHNQQFVEQEMICRAEFFAQATKFPLDEKQRRAVITDEDNTLVVAGAGSGKTLTIVAKIKYLVEVLGVPAEQILPISFTHKSAEEMRQRIAVPGIEPQTFHKFGLRVIRQVQGEVGIKSEANDEAVFRRFVRELVDADPQYLAKLNHFLLYYFKIPKSQFEFKTLGEYIQYLKDQNFTTLKQITKKYTDKTNKTHPRQTLKNEVVKSIEECQIANFLTLHQVEYQYEQLYRPPMASSARVRQQSFRENYKPDFTITTDDGQVIYLEHFGMDKRGNVPAFFAKPGETQAQATARYQASYHWKKRLHRQYQTHMIETYSHQFDDGKLFEHLKRELTRSGVTLKPLTPFEQWQLIQKTSADQVDGSMSLVQTFLALLKSNNYQLSEVRSLNQSKPQNGFLRRRAELFLELFEPIYAKYQEQLASESAIDFSDMINRASTYLASGQYRCPLKYVIVDEFQDLSFGRYQILQAIRQQNPDVKFYCVGDDWQSIFRFTGSDITLFSQFERYFGVTSLLRIETTYRFNQPLISLSSDFILKNPHQLPKKLVAPADKPPTSYQIIESTADDDTEAVIQAMKQLLADGARPDDSFYLIGRYNFDFTKRIVGRNHRLRVNYQQATATYLITDGQWRGQQANLQFITAHKSKGLEADYVIVLNCNSGKYGFPSGKSDDPILSLVLSSGDQFPDGEERRLFYVAMTRAKKAVVFITNKYRKSKFIKELEPLLNNHDRTAIRCPRCGHGEIIKRQGPFSEFYGCTNWEYGCDYRSKQPPTL